MCLRFICHLFPLAHDISMSLSVVLIIFSQCHPKPTQSVYVTAGDSDDLVDDANTLSGFGTTTDWWTV